MEENENRTGSDDRAEADSKDTGHDASYLAQQLQLQEAEKRKLQNEFNAQRAKLRELFMQKEAENAKCQVERQALRRELDEMKSQFVVADLKSENELRFKEMKAHEEISSLQQLVQDTIDESTEYKAELEHIRAEYNRLKLELRELRDGMQQPQQQTEPTSLAPQVLSQVKKTLQRSVLGSSFHQESVDDGTRGKSVGKQYAYEDAEVLRSIVVQLQEEMKALKEKVREADEKLQAGTSSGAEVSTNADKLIEVSAESSDMQAINKSTSMELSGATVECETCRSYEQKLQDLLAKATESQELNESLQKSIDESREDLQKEAALRKDLEDQWQEKREAHKAEVQLLRDQVKRNEHQLLDLQQKMLETKDEVVRQLQRITDDRERVNKQLETLQADNDFLSGCYLATAEEIENQYINLPNTVEELQELTLRQQNDLIQARVGSAYEKQKCMTSLDEIQILRDQLEASNNERRAYKKKEQTEIKSLQNRLTEYLLKQQNYEATNAALERKEAELNRQISAFRVEIIELQENNEKLSKINGDCKAKIKNLQDDLATSEQVQKDFVKLSQTLQMSLEKLRHADTEVRWQDDEDIDNCPSCKTGFTVTVRKIHCRHCGHIYCDKCLTKTVPSGPRKRIARVCDICHTLLTPNTAPYFSHEPLQSS